MGRNFKQVMREDIAGFDVLALSYRALSQAIDWCTETVRFLEHAKEAPDAITALDLAGDCARAARACMRHRALADAAMQRARGLGEDWKKQATALAERVYWVARVAEDAAKEASYVAGDKPSRDTLEETRALAAVGA